MLKRQHLTVESKLDALFGIQQWFNDWYSSLELQLGWVKDCRDRLNIAVAEGFTNAVRHAHAMLPAETPIVIDVCLDGDRITIRIWDYGCPFDPDTLEEPEPGALLADGGYGWFLLRRVADHVSYRRRGTQNCLEITQYRADPSYIRLTLESSSSH